MTPIKQIEEELTAKGNNRLLNKIRWDFFYLTLMVYFLLLLLHELLSSRTDLLI